MVRLDRGLRSTRNTGSIFEKERALCAELQKIEIKEPMVDGSIDSLKGLKLNSKDDQKLKDTNDAIKAAVELSATYINDRKPTRPSTRRRRDRRAADAGAGSERKKRSA